MTMLVLPLPIYCARSLDGWGFLRPIPLLGANQEINESDSPHPSRAATSAGSQWCEGVQSDTSLWTQRNMTAVEAKSSHVYHVHTHICVHITRLRTHKITDRSYPHPVSFIPHRREQRGASGPSERSIVRSIVMSPGIRIPHAQHASTRLPGSHTSHSLTCSLCDRV